MCFCELIVSIAQSSKHAVETFEATGSIIRFVVFMFVLKTFKVSFFLPVLTPLQC